MVETWVVGMIISLCGNICINLGANCIKHSYAQERQRHDSSLRSANSSVLSNAEQLDGVPNAPPPASQSSSLLVQCCLFPFIKLRSFFHWLMNQGRWWYVGAFITICGNLANFISLSFASQSLLAGLGSSQFLMNAVCEWYFNGNNITARTVKSTVMIVIGNTLIVAFASHQSPKLTVDELFSLLFETPFDIYIVILMILTLLCQIFYNETNKSQKSYLANYSVWWYHQQQVQAQAAQAASMRGGPQQHAQLVHGPNLSGVLEQNGVVSGSSGDGQHRLASHHSSGSALSANGSASGGRDALIVNGDGSSQIHHHVLAHHASSGGSPPLPPLGGNLRSIPEPIPLPAWRIRMLPFSYAAVSAIVGTQAVLLAKSTSDLIRTSIAGNNQFASAFSWVILVCWLCTIVFWMWRQDTAYRKFHNTAIIPVLQVVWTLFSIIGGGIYFKEFFKMSSLAIGLFTLGVAIMIGGMYLLAFQPGRGHGSGGSGLRHPAGGMHMHHHAMQHHHMQHMAHLHHHHHGGVDPDLYGSQHRHDALSDVELGERGVGVGVVNSPYEIRSHDSALLSNVGVVSPGPVQIHGLFGAAAAGGSGVGDVHSHNSSSGHSKDDVIPSVRSSVDMHPTHALVLNPPPPKITRVTSTGRMIIQNDVAADRDVYVVVGDSSSRGSAGHNNEISPDFRPFEHAPRRGGASSGFDEDRLTDDESGAQKLRTASIDSVGHAMAMEKLAMDAPAASSHHTLRQSNSSELGVLGESGLLAGVGTSTPPLRPNVHWGTPTRPTSGGSEFSRPASASGREFSGSIPPSPALHGFDLYAQPQPQKRSRGMSLGFSMPMVDFDDDNND